MLVQFTCSSERATYQNIFLAKECTIFLIPWFPSDLVLCPLWWARWGASTEVGTWNQTVFASTFTAHEVMLIDTIKNERTGQVALKKEMLKARQLKFNWIKTKYIKYNYNENTGRSTETEWLDTAARQGLFSFRLANVLHGLNGNKFRCFLSLGETTR